MKSINWDEVEDNILPEGWYTVQIIKVEEKRTCTGDDMLNVRYEITKGPYKGRLIFDNIVFSEAALKRAKLILTRLGIELRNNMDITTDMLLGRHVEINIVIEEFDGIIRNRVPFAGYRKIQTESELEMPF